MPTNNTSSRPRTSFLKLRWVFALLACVGVLTAVGYAARSTLLLAVARIVLNHDSELVAQERADVVAIAFPKPASLWVTPMKNQMNRIWDPIKANGVNYYMFAKPQTWFRSYSERTNPISPYYQAWVGGYVIKTRDGSLPADLETLAWQVTALDQRSWLSAMGDPHPIADASLATRVGDITIDSHRVPLWHGTMQSHSDLSAHPTGPLATLIGMPPKSLWPKGIDSFHNVSLDGYFACWSDSQLKISIVIYAVAADYVAQTEERRNSGLINDDLLRLMKTAKLEAVH
ncbi:MAG TPA: hypothetical protein VIY50_06130 [Steroidobacteraceae bacterium]